MSGTSELRVAKMAVLPARPNGSARNKKRAPAKIDGRFVLGKRITQLVALYRERLNATGPDADPVLLAAIERAARLTALAEDASARAVRGDPNIALDDVVRISRTADLAVRRLHLDCPKSKPSVDLSAYIAARGEQP